MTDKRDSAIEHIIEKIYGGEANIRKLKYQAGRLFGLSDTVRNSEILERIDKTRVSKQALEKLRKKPMRTLSGVTPIAVMIKPQGSCNWGCIYCPFTGKAAKSYTGEEPAALRSRMNDYDPKKQAEDRLGQFEKGGHPTDKCEVIVMGGTFLAMEKEYKEFFIRGIYDALNGCRSTDIENAKKLNESAGHRVVGLTIETRPDVCMEKQINEILSYGATKVELGVQNPDDGLYKITNRGHTVNDVINATTLLKDAALKVLYHVMPGLPGSDPETDINAMKMIFSDERFKPDMLKIYPTLVIEGTGLYEMMKRGEYEPYDSEKAADVISECYRVIPKYVRVMRIQRDIPATLISEGVKKSNLRELVEEAMRKKGIIPDEIRAREIGLRKGDFKSGEFRLKRLDYAASRGKEVFLLFENQKENLIAGFIRLRIPGKSWRPEITDKTALIRELHVYGNEAVISGSGDVQHRGLGRQLLEEAEKIAMEEYDKTKMVIMSGVGVREYYRKFGYGNDGPYVSKFIK